VAGGRVHFLSRVSKEKHIRRHLEIDLFLDSLVYGAHSTATDALMGGLPVLTLAGESFPQRVGASLLTSLQGPDTLCSGDSEAGGDACRSRDRARGSSPPQQQQWEQREQREAEGTYNLLNKVLQTFSKKSFEDVAVKLLHSPVMLRRLRQLLLQASGSLEREGGGGGRHARAGLFDTEGLVRDFLRGVQAATEVERLQAAGALAAAGDVPRQGGALELNMPHIIVTRH
jgi:hypothetical protein